MSDIDEQFMRLAIELAREAELVGEGPVGAGGGADDDDDVRP